MDQAQKARNLTDAGDGFLRNTRYLIHDRDPMFTRQFVEILKSAGVETVKLPARSPNMNAYAERFVRSIKQECLRHIVPLGERHLRNVIPFPSAVTSADGRVCRRDRLGGLLNFYERKAA